MAATHAGAHTHVHEGDIMGDLPDALVRQFADEWQAAEDRIKRENDLKAAMLAKVRAVHGVLAANALKAAMRLAAQDPEKRARADVTNAIARRFLRIIEGRDGRSRFEQ